MFDHWFLSNSIDNWLILNSYINYRDLLSLFWTDTFIVIHSQRPCLNKSWHPSRESTKTSKFFHKFQRKMQQATHKPTRFADGQSIMPRHNRYSEPWTLLCVEAGLDMLRLQTTTAKHVSHSCTGGSSWLTVIVCVRSKLLLVSQHGHVFYFQEFFFKSSSVNGKHKLDQSKCWTRRISNT